MNLVSYMHLNFRTAFFSTLEIHADIYAPQLSNRFLLSDSLEIYAS